MRSTSTGSLSALTVSTSQAPTSHGKEKPEKLERCGLASYASNQQAETPSEASFSEQWKFVYNYVNKRVEDHQLAEDITQEAFLKAWKSRAKFKPKIGKLSTWICAIARNEIVNQIRKASKYSGVSGSSEVIESIAAKPTDSSIDNDTKVVVNEILKALDRGLNQKGKKPFYGTILYKRFLGIDSIELSKILGIPRGTIRWRTFFAKDLFMREWFKRKEVQ